MIIVTRNHERTPHRLLEEVMITCNRGTEDRDYVAYRSAFLRRAGELKEPKFDLRDRERLPSLYTEGFL